MTNDDMWPEQPVKPLDDTKNQLDRLLFELEDATLCSYGDIYSQNEAAKERAIEARKAIKNLFLQERMQGRLIQAQASLSKWDFYTEEKIATEFDTFLKGQVEAHEYELAALKEHSFKEKE